MGNFNFDWLKENFKNDNIFFDIGCANMSESLKIRNIFPKAIICAFECCDYWKNKNEIIANEYKINYSHVALSDINGTILFYPSNTLKGEKWPWSGSICAPDKPLINDRWEWGDSYLVESMTLETYCNKTKYYPDFLWIDAQGAEQKILSAMGNIRPKAIWAETSEFNMYVTNTDYENFLNFMDSLGYTEHFKDIHDSLFVLKNSNVKEYVK